MGATASAVRIRHDLHTRLINARKRTDELFRIVREDSIYDRPIAERHRIIFYIGHVEAFDWNLLAQRAFGLQSFHPAFDQLFAFGIDRKADFFNNRVINTTVSAVCHVLKLNGRVNVI